jgi:hypothetical protein
MNAVSGAVQAASNRSSIGPMMSMSCVNGGVVHSKNDGGSVSLARGRLRPPPSSCMSLNQNRLRIHQEHRLLLTQRPCCCVLHLHRQWNSANLGDGIRSFASMENVADAQ